MKTVLFVGGGRRYELANRFKERGFSVYGYETSKDVPLNTTYALTIGKRFDDPDCLADLRNAVKEYKADIVLPLMDAAVPIVAELEVPVCSRPVPARTCWDKKMFESFMLNSNWKDHYPYFPVERDSINAYGHYIVKPRFGFGSKGVHTKLKTEGSMLIETSHTVYQRLIGGVEYSADAYFNVYSEFVDCVIRSRERVAGGEVLDSVTVDNDEIRNLVKEIGEAIPITGPCNMQFIVDKDGKPWIIEVNARFGGGWTFSMEAGLDAISLIENDYFGGQNYYIPGQTKKLRLRRSYRDHYFEV